MAHLPAASVKTKMADTITIMDYRIVDTLNADQLEVGDLIGLADEVVEVVNIISTKEGYALTFKNEFGEQDIIEIDDNETFDLYLLD